MTVAGDYGGSDFGPSPRPHNPVTPNDAQDALPLERVLEIARKVQAPTPTPPDDEREAKLREVYEAARGLCFGTDWNNGTQAATHGYRARLINAVNAVEQLPGKASAPAADDWIDAHVIAKAYEALQENNKSVPTPYGVRCMRAAITAALAARSKTQ